MIRDFLEVVILVAIQHCICHLCLPFFTCILNFVKKYVMKIESISISYSTPAKNYSLKYQIGSELSYPELQIKSKRVPLPQGEQIQISLHPQTKIHITSAAIEMSHHYHADQRIFLNGYQSWTESKEYGIEDQLPPLRPVLAPIYWHYQMPLYGDYLFYPSNHKQGYLHGFTYSYIRQGNNYQFIGSLSEEKAFTIIQHQVPKKRIQILKDCDGMEISSETTIFDLFIGWGQDQKLYQQYFDLMGLPFQNQTDVTGWTSWYNYYTGITQEIISENLEAFASRRIPIDIFQIDDGYQQAVGDWLQTNTKFPAGMKVIADQIHQAGYKAGLWLAPFICEENSEIFRLKQDWILKDQKKNPLVAGYTHLWSGKFYALDFEHPEVREYLRQVFYRVLHEWDFDMVKLDFLYAVALQPRHGKTRGQLMAEAMNFLVELCREKQILGCGVPLGSVFGKVDFCRIGSDIGLSWEEWKLQSALRFRERVSSYSALQSTIHRRGLHQRAFINDPDVFLLRSENMRMNENQKKTIFILNLLFGGLLFTSDNLNQYSNDQIHLYSSQFPLKKRVIQQVQQDKDAFMIQMQSEEKNYVILANLTGHTRKMNLPTGRIYSMDTTFVQGSVTLSPYQTHCYLQVPALAGQVAGSNGHLFPAMDVDSLQGNASSGYILSTQSFLLSVKVMIRVNKHTKKVKINRKWLTPKIWDSIHYVEVELQPKKRK